MSTHADPPDGWYRFGTHCSFPLGKTPPLEFSDELDDALMPLWERRTDTFDHVLVEIERRLGIAKLIAGGARGELDFWDGYIRACDELTAWIVLHKR